METMVIACVTLHNTLMTAFTDDGALGDRENEQHNLIPGLWRDDAVLDYLERRLYGNNTSRAMKRQILYLKHYYNGDAVQCFLIVTVISPFHELVKCTSGVTISYTYLTFALLSCPIKAKK